MADSDNSLGLLIAFIGGIAVGANWDKIKEQSGPYLKIAKRFLAEQKEKIEDILEEEKPKKKKR